MGIFVIDDQPLMRDAISRLIHRIQRTASIVEFECLNEALTFAYTNDVPQLITMDLKVSDNVDVLGVRQLKKQFPDAHLVVLCAAPARQYEERCMESGADAYIAKSAAATEILSVLQLFLQQDLDPSTTTTDGTTAAPTEKLSKRQKELLVMLNKGLSNRDIAQGLGISEHTVKVHLWRLFKRLNVKSRSQASHVARTHELL